MATPTLERPCFGYGESPFFIYYEDDIRPFFERRWDYLFDFNMETTLKLCELLDVEPNISVTDHYVDASVARPRLHAEALLSGAQSETGIPTEHVGARPALQ